MCTRLVALAFPTTACSVTELRSVEPLFGVRRHLSSSSSFQPSAPPPDFEGNPVFNDIILNAPSFEASERNTDPTAVFVVTGASRGIGWQLTKSLLTRTEGRIVACCRSPGDIDSQLNEFLDGLDETSSSRISVLPLDLEDQSQIDNLGRNIKNRFDRVDALFNVAGILGDGINTPGPERTLAKLDRTWLDKSMAVNVIGPAMVSQSLAPIMKTTNKSPERATSVIVNMSARVGSISDNKLGGWYSYRLSKAALNQFTRTAALELKRQGTWAIALHPGTTDTDLSKPFQRNVQKSKLFPAEFTVERMLDLVDSMKDEHSGGFFDWAGKALPY